MSERPSDRDETSDKYPQASQYPPDPRPVTWIVQADYHMASENRPCRSLGQVVIQVVEAMERGAAEVRIRPFTDTRGEANSKSSAGGSEI